MVRNPNESDELILLDAITAQAYSFGWMTANYSREPSSKLPTVIQV